MERHVGAIGVERVQGVVDEVKHILLRRLMLGDAPRKLSNCYKQTETVNTHTRRKNSEYNVIEALLRKETENAEKGEGMKFSANGMCTFDRFNFVGGGERGAGEQKESK